jgi:hypothetical protein
MHKGGPETAPADLLPAVPPEPLAAYNFYLTRERAVKVHEWAPGHSPWLGECDVATDEEKAYRRRQTARSKPLSPEEQQALIKRLKALPAVVGDVMFGRLGSTDHYRGLKFISRSETGADYVELDGGHAMHDTWTTL